MSFLSMPDQVIWELMDNDGYDEYPTRRTGPSTTYCKSCYAHDLKWYRGIGERWRLIYGQSYDKKIRGKVHACQSEQTRYQ